MARFVVTRVLYALAALLLLATLTFFMMQAMPGDPFLQAKRLPDNVVANLRVKWGLDKPVIEQYIVYLKNLVQGDFGYSYYYKGSRTVAEVITQGFPNSFDVGLRALFFAVVVGLSLGTAAALNSGKATDTIARFISVMGVSVPSFVIAYLAQFYIAYKFGGALKNWFALTNNPIPVTGWSSEAHKIMPMIALSLGTLASMSRMMRSSVLDVLSSDYIRAAKAKGLSRTEIIFKHVLRNSLLPVITILGPTAAAILTGGFVVESIFSIPGIGRLFITSVQNQDYTVIMGTTLFYGAILIACNLIVDLFYGVIDPRIRISA